MRLKKSPRGWKKINFYSDKMKKTPLSKTAKERTPSFYRKKAVEVAKLIAKHRDGYKCVNPKCGKSAELGYQMHGSHILNEGTHHRMSVEIENIMCQCAQHHMDWHGNPLLQQWFEERFPNRKQTLLEQDRFLNLGYIKPDYKKILEKLKEEYKKIIN